MAIRYKSQVTSVPAATSEEAQTFFQNKLGFETDCADVHFDIEHKVDKFILVDVRSPEDYAICHVPEAINIPISQITEHRIKSEYPDDTVFITYCWGPGCNGATKGAIRFSTLGYPVKEMIGGIEYWQKEGYSTTTA